MEEDRRQDNKRLTDLQGEISALRKRADEQRGKVELITENQKKSENRLTDILATESERREEQAAFVESVNLNQMEWEKTWKEWNKRFDKFDAQSEKLQEYLKNIEDAEREVKKAQEAFEEITDQIKRRINEITEMQRLGEERFRQEWSTFKADDQKRWTNYTLTQEEQHREMNRQLDRLADQSTNLDDSLQELQDSVQHINEQSDKVLQTLMGAIREWVAENERFLSSVR
jgi:predicted  nucleic acid-binding Zn-ribbon protein